MTMTRDDVGWFPEPIELPNGERIVGVVVVSAGKRPEVVPLIVTVHLGNSLLTAAESVDERAQRT